MKTLVLNDVHVPFQSRRWQRKLDEYLNKESPGKIVLAGDLADFHALSTHTKHRDWEDRLDREVAALGIWLDDLRGKAPNSEIVYIEGNHEYRWTRYVDSNAPKFRNLSMNWHDVVALEDFDIRLVQCGHKVPTGCGQAVYIYHGHEHKVSSKMPGGTAKRMAENLGRNVHCGHTHRVGQGFTNAAGKKVFYHEGGFGGDIKKPAFGFVSAKNTDWIMGFTVYDSEEKTSPLPRFIKA